MVKLEQRIYPTLLNVYIRAYISDISITKGKIKLNYFHISCFHKLSQRACFRNISQTVSQVLLSIDKLK